MDIANNQRRHKRSSSSNNDSIRRFNCHLPSPRLTVKRASSLLSTGTINSTSLALYCHLLATLGDTGWHNVQDDCNERYNEYRQHDDGSGSLGGDSVADDENK